MLVVYWTQRKGRWLSTGHKGRDAGCLLDAEKGTIVVYWIQQKGRRFTGHRGRDAGCLLVTEGTLVVHWTQKGR